jgi:hypothetical protein
MDTELSKLLDIVDDDPDCDATVRFADPAAGTIQVTAGEAIHNYTLRPLSELYGPGTGLETLDPTANTFVPLLLSIEEVFLTLADANPKLTDADVAVSLDRLCMSPEAAVPSDPLVGAVQLRLRLTLSLNDYSRQDVRHALRKVKQSVARHTRLAGPRGYLTFIRQQLRRDR